MTGRPPLGQLPEHFDYDPTDPLTSDQHRERARVLIRAAEETIVRSADARRGPVGAEELWSAANFATIARAHIDMARELDRVADRRKDSTS